MNQIVLKLVYTANKKGNQTLGVIIKPDTLIISSKSKAIYVFFVRNQDIKFWLSQYILKNIDSKTKEWLLTDCDVKKEKFFSQKI